jgi:arylsulfatase A-like enzyme
MYISFMAPHDPRTMPKEYLEMYPPDKMELPPNFLPRHPFNFGKILVRDELLAPWPRTAATIRRHIAEYYAMISHLDAQIGRVLSELDRLGLRENTLILLAGDNGLAVGQHGLMGKQNNYEHSIRVPLIMCGPGIPQNEKRDAFVYLLDLYPTLCELIGIEVPTSVEGKSLVPAIKDSGEKIRDSLFFAYEEFQRSVRTDRFKLIEYVVRDKRHTQLFDLDNDRWETQNLAENVDHRETVDELRRKLYSWRDLWDDRDSHWGKIFWSGFDT